MRLRGVKGIREALEQQPDLVVLNPKDYKGNWSENFFKNNYPIHVELGMGKGKFISELSLLNPNINYIGVDMYDELIRKASIKARRSREENDKHAKLYKTELNKHISSVENKLIKSANCRSFFNYVNKKIKSKCLIPPLNDSSDNIIADNLEKAKLFSSHFSSVFVKDNSVMQAKVCRRITIILT